MKVKLLFFFSFVLASAALVQHGAKLPLSNKVERFRRKVFLLGRRFLLLIEFKFHHTMLVLKAFLAISEGLVSDNQSSPLPPPLLRDLPLRSHLVLLLVRSHHPVKNIWLCFCLKVKTEQQNQSRSLQNDTGIQNTAKVVALQ